MELKLSGQSFKWTFLRAEVQMAILGIDFLRAYKLWTRLLANWSRVVLALPSPPSHLTVGRQLWPSSHQLFLVLLAGQPLHHQLSLVLLARQPHHHQQFLLLASRQSHHHLQPQSPVIRCFRCCRQQSRAAGWLLSSFCFSVTRTL